MFPINPSIDTHMVRNREHFKVNKTHTEIYKKSAIPYLQRKLNLHFNNLHKDGRESDEARLEESE